MGYYIYKHLNKENEVIYVGQTKDMDDRQGSHKNSSDWAKEIKRIEFTEVSDSMIMDIYEKYYISKLTPKYNKKDIDCKYSDFFVSMKELEFKEYIKQKKGKKPEFHETFDDHYNKAKEFIDGVSVGFLKKGRICNTHILEMPASCFDCSGFSVKHKSQNIKINILMASFDDTRLYYRNIDFDLNKYNHLKTPEQIEYKSLNKMWEDMINLKLCKK